MNLAYLTDIIILLTAAVIDQHREQPARHKLRY
jgi:hypothetical protein